MWVGALFSRTFLAKASLSDLLLDSFGILTQALVALFIGMYFSDQLGFTPVQLLFYYLFVLALINPLQRRAPLREIESQMLTGSITQHLLKPYNFIVFICARSFAQAVLLCGIIGVAVTIYFFAGFGTQIVAAWSWMYVLRLILAGVVSIVYLYLTIAILLCLSLFLEKINAYYRMYFMLGFFVAGGFFPAGLLGFPIVEYLPQYYLFGAPATFVATGNVLHPLLWMGYVVLFMLINVFLYRQMVRRLEVNGG